MASLGPARNLQGGGLKLPPFPPRIRLEGNPNEALKHVLHPSEANEFKEVIFGLLDQFDGYVRETQSNSQARQFMVVLLQSTFYHSTSVRTLPTPSETVQVCWKVSSCRGEVVTSNLDMGRISSF